KPAAAPSAAYLAARQAAARHGPARRRNGPRPTRPGQPPNHRSAASHLTVSAAQHPAPGTRPSPRELHALPALPGDLRDLTAAGLARVLLIVRDDQDRRRITDAYFAARAAPTPPATAAEPISGRGDPL